MNRSVTLSCIPKLTQADISYYPILALKPSRSDKGGTLDRSYDPWSNPASECYTIGHFRAVPS
jgi:hypothetical protein